MWISYLHFSFPTWQKTPFTEKWFHVCNCCIFWRGRKGSSSSKPVSKNLAGVLHDCRGYYWRSFPPGPFAMWNGSWMSELVLLGGPAMQADWAGFGWLVPLTPLLHNYFAVTWGWRLHLWDAQLLFCRCPNKSDHCTPLLFILVRKPPICLHNNLIV